MVKSPFFLIPFLIFPKWIDWKIGLTNNGIGEGLIFFTDSFL